MEIFYDCLPNENVETVAFTVALNLDDHRYFLASEAVLPYNSVYTNIGGYFDENTKAFFCPVDGVYLFAVSIQTSSQDDQAAVSIYVNSNIQRFYIHANSRNGEDNDAASMVVTLHLQAGDRVYIATRLDSFFAADYVRNVFTGFLVSRT